MKAIPEVEGQCYAVYVNGVRVFVEAPNGAAAICSFLKAAGV